jgi:hypothetical protein
MDTPPKNFPAIGGVAESPVTANGPQYVRKHWRFIVAYYLATSIGTGITLAAFFLLMAAADRTPKPISVRQALHISFFFMGVCSPSAFVVQLVGGPIFVTRNLICATCHFPRTLARNPLFGPRSSKVPKCENCGGDLEPASFWKLEP